MFSDVLIGALILAAMLGIPTVGHWVWSGRKSSLVSSYYQVLIYFFTWFGAMFALVATIILVCALLDQVFHLGWGYPIWSDPLLIALVAVGIIIRRVSKSYLRRGAATVS